MEPSAEEQLLVAQQTPPSTNQPISSLQTRGARQFLLSLTEKIKRKPVFWVSALILLAIVAFLSYYFGSPLGLIFLPSIISSEFFSTPVEYLTDHPFILIAIWVVLIGLSIVAFIRRMHILWIISLLVLIIGTVLVISPQLSGLFYLAAILQQGQEMQREREQPIPIDTYKSEILLANDTISHARTFNLTAANEKAVVFYKQDLTTHLREVHTGKDVTVPFPDPLFEITPKGEYLFINFHIGKAALINSEIKLERLYEFTPVDIKTQQDLVNISYDFAYIWLDDHRFWVNEVIFDTEEGKIHPVVNYITKQKIYFGDCLYQDPNQELCYTVRCNKTGSLLDTSDQIRFLESEEARYTGFGGALYQSEFACVEQRVAEIFHRSQGHEVLLATVDGNKDNNLAVSVGGSSTFVQLISTYSGILKKTKLLPSPSSTYTDLLSDKEFDKISKSGIKYARKNISAKVCDLTCSRLYSSFIIFDRNGKEIGRINRKKIEVVGEPNERGEVFLITEKGIEKVILPT